MGSLCKLYLFHFTILTIFFIGKDGYGPWIETIPEDPYAGSGIYYRYKCNREGFVLFSVGSDGKASSNISNGILGDDKGYHEYNEE